MPQDKWSSRTWHRKASRPVSIWMMVFIVVGAAHIFVPNYRWVLIHLFTLGLVTNSILVWSQHLTEKFVQQKLPDSARPKQLARIYILNIGIIIAVAGQILVQFWAHHWILTQIGATLIALTVLWHAVSLFAQWRTAKDKRFRPVVGAYVLSALCLPVGAVFGAILAIHPGDPQLLLAHIAANIGGFIGLAAAGSLTILFPTIWRTQGTNERMSSSFALLTLGVVATSIGAFLNFPQLGLIIYCIGWILSLQQWLGNVIDVARAPRDRVNFASVSVLMATLWLVLSLAYYTTQHFLVAEPGLPTLGLVVGFAAQLLIGVMSYLLPTTMGGGPGAVRAGLQELDRWGLLRATFVNGGLLIWMGTDISLLKVVASLLCIGSLTVYPIFIARAVKAQKQVLMKKAEGPAPKTTADWNQIYIGIAILAVIYALFAAL